MMQVLQGGRGADGASAVELALVLPVLIMLLFGAIQFGQLFLQDLAVGNAAREGARIGVVAGTTCGEVMTRARDVAAASSSIDRSLVVVDRTLVDDSATPVATQPCPPHAGGSDASLPCDGADVGDRLVVTTTYVGRLDIPLVMSRTVDLTGTGVFRCEYT